MVSRVFTPDEIGRELIATDKRIRTAVIRGLRLAARLGEAEIKREIVGNDPFPVVDTGELLRSVRTDRLPDGAELVVSAPHAVYQELGTGPNVGRPPFTPPFEVIEAWAIRKSRGFKQRKGPSRKTKAGAGEPVTRRRGKETSATGDSRVQRDRRKTKAGRAAAKGSRRSAARAVKSMTGAVWMQIKRFGVKPKRFVERASKKFPGHVESQVAAQVARVRD
jgi:hypothetical protein